MEAEDKSHSEELNRREDNREGQQTIERLKDEVAVVRDTVRRVGTREAGVNELFKKYEEGVNNRDLFTLDQLAAHMNASDCLVAAIQSARENPWRRTKKSCAKWVDCSCERQSGKCSCGPNCRCGRLAWETRPRPVSKGCAFARVYSLCE